MTLFRTQRLVLRNWKEGDRDLFHRINSDEKVMEFFPFRRNRTDSDAKMDEFCAKIDENGFGWSAIEVAATGECIGFAGLSKTEDTPFMPQGTIEIGWRLAPEFWGNGYVSEAARAWLAFGFEKLNCREIVSFAVVANHRSLAVMERLGMTADPARDFDHPGVPDSHPHLKRHKFYRMTAEEWAKRKKAAS